MADEDGVRFSRTEVVGRLRELVEIESPSGDVTASRAVASVLHDWLSEAGARVRHHDTDLGRSIVAEVGPEAGSGAQGGPLLLVGHSDTVWPVGTLHGAVPWSHEGDVVRGPGALDMKSGLVAMVTALAAVRDVPHLAVRVVVVCDEEVGSPSTRELIAQSAVGARGALAFECPHPDGALKVGRRGSTRLRIEVTGRAAHAALDPESGVSAVDELVDQLLVVRDVVRRASRTSQVLCNVGTVAGGTRANVVPAAASAEVGLRFPDPDTERDVLTALSHLEPRRDGATIATTILSNRPAWLPGDGDHALLGRLVAAGESLGQVVQGRPAAGAGDANLLGAAGVPTVDGLGPRGGGAHATDEHLSLDSLLGRIALLTRLLAAPSPTD